MSEIYHSYYSMKSRLGFFADLKKMYKKFVPSIFAKKKININILAEYYEGSIVLTRFFH